MASPINLILDASVFAKWFLVDEHDRDIALQIRLDYLNGRISISLPSLIFYEVNNFLKSAVLRFRIKPKVALDCFNGFLELELRIYPADFLQDQILKNALVYNISSYDSSYVTLAQYLKIPYFTADKRLVKAVKSNLVRHISKYPKLLQLK
jgi:predicted nucleic acid-binding protein